MKYLSDAAFAAKQRQMALDNASRSISENLELEARESRFDLLKNSKCSIDVTGLQWPHWKEMKNENR